MKTASNPYGSSNIFAKRLSNIMKQTKTSQQKLAEAAGVSRQTIAQYVDGSVVPTIERLYRISEFFKVSSDYLIGRVNVKPTNVGIQVLHKQLGLSAAAIRTLLFYKRDVDGETILSVVNFLLEQQCPWPILKPPPDCEGDKDLYKYETFEYFYEPGLEKRERGNYCPILTKISQFLSLQIDREEELHITLAGSVGSKEAIEKKELHHWKDSYDIAKINSSTLIENALLMEISDMLRELKPKWPVDEAEVEELPEF